MNRDDDALGLVWPRCCAPEAERDSVIPADSDGFSWRQIAEIHAPERIADRGEGRRRIAGSERNHAGEDGDGGPDYSAKDDQDYPQASLREAK